MYTLTNHGIQRINYSGKGFSVNLLPGESMTLEDDVATSLRELHGDNPALRFTPEDEKTRKVEADPKKTLNRSVNPEAVTKGIAESSRFTGFSGPDFEPNNPNKLKVMNDDEKVGMAVSEHLAGRPEEFEKIKESLSNDEARKRLDEKVKAADEAKNKKPEAKK